MPLEGIKVGPQTLGDGAVSQQRGGKAGEAIVGNLNPYYQEMCYRGLVFMASNQAGIATPTGLTTAAKNFTLYNPLGSGKNLVLIDVTMAATVVPATFPGVVGLVGNLTSTQAAPATVTAETVRCALLGSTATAVGLVYNTCTLAATPVYLRSLASAAWVTTGTGTALGPVKDLVDGAIILAPGIYVSIASTAALTLQVAMTWAEIPT